MHKGKNWESRIFGNGNTLAVRGRLVLTFVWTPGQLPVFIQPSSPFSVQQCLKTSTDTGRPKEKSNRRNHKRVRLHQILKSGLHSSFPVPKYLTVRIHTSKHLDKRVRFPGNAPCRPEKPENILRFSNQKPSSPHHKVQGFLFRDILN